MDLISRLAGVGDAVGTVTTLAKAGFLAPMRPDRAVRIMAAARSEGLSITTGFTTAARRCPERHGLVDELGALTWRELEDRSHALAAGLQHLRDGRPKVIAVMCRNHRGFVESLVAVTRIGADLLLLNTSLAGPALADAITRENVDAVIYDEEFTESVDRALSDHPQVRRILAWTDRRAPGQTVEKLIHINLGRRPAKAYHKSRLILLTSGTTGTPKGAKHSGGGASNLVAILRRTPWRLEETTVVVAPMFHAWGLSQLVFASAMACTVVTQRTFDPEATLALVDRHQATGLCAAPLMFDQIMDLPDDVRHQYSGKSLRFAACAGSRMRPDVVTRFMDEFGDIIYNNYVSTEAGMIATATPADLRAAPDTAGTPAMGTEIRIYDEQFDETPAGSVGRIFVKNETQFDGYTSGNTNDFHDGFMSSGDLGRVDENGRLFVVARDSDIPRAAITTPADTGGSGTDA